MSFTQKQKHLAARICSILLFACIVVFCAAQPNSVVQVHADKSSGYGVAYGGPQNQPNLIVTALHIVSGKSQIAVVWQGKTSYADIVQVYKPSDLALLRLKTPLDIPNMKLYSGEPPWGTNVNFWEVPVNTRLMSAKNTVLEERTSLSRISPRVANNQQGLTKALCQDQGQYYPGINTQVINFKEPNIRKAHSGSPLTYNNAILGMVDGGANLVGGTSCVWAIPAADFNKLFAQGTVPGGPMQACEVPGKANQYMFSGLRSDNPFLSPEEIQQAQQVENPINYSTNGGGQLSIYHDYRMGFYEIYETLFEDEQMDISELFESEEQISLDDLLNQTVDLYQDEWTGVSLLVPAQCHLEATSDEYGTALSAMSPGGAIQMMFYVSPTDDMDAGLEVLSGFKSSMMDAGFPMDVHPDDVEDYRDDPYTPYYSEYAEDALENEDGEVVAEFFADMMINDGDFFAVTVYISDWSRVENDPNERLFLYLMETCAMMSDFALY